MGYTAYSMCRREYLEQIKSRGMYLKLQMPELMTCDALNQPTSITNFYTKTWKDFISYNAENNSTKKKIQIPKSQCTSIFVVHGN